MLTRRELVEGRDSLVVVFSPNQTLQNAEACRTALQDAIGDAREVVLDASEVADVDLTFLQTLTALRRSAALLRLPVTWSAAPAAAVSALAEALGFARPATDDGAFWRECPR